MPAYTSEHEANEKFISLKILINLHDIFKKESYEVDMDVSDIEEAIREKFDKDSSFINKLTSYQSSLILEALKNSYDAGADQIQILCLSNGNNELICFDDKYETKTEGKILSEENKLATDTDFSNLFKKKSAKKGNSSCLGGNNLGIISLYLAGRAYSEQFYDISANSKSENFQMALVNSSVTNGVRLILKGNNGDYEFNYKEACKVILNVRENGQGMEDALQQLRTDDTDDFMMQMASNFNTVTSPMLMLRNSNESENSSPSKYSALERESNLSKSESPVRDRCEIESPM